VNIILYTIVLLFDTKQIVQYMVTEKHKLALLALIT